jgi:hypothetical protein
MFLPTLCRSSCKSVILEAFKAAIDRKVVPKKQPRKKVSEKGKKGAENQLDLLPDERKEPDATEEDKEDQ